MLKRITGCVIVVGSIILLHNLLFPITKGDTRELNLEIHRQHLSKFETATEDYIEERRLEQERLNEIRIQEEQARLEMIKIREESKKQYYTFEVSFYCPCWSCTQNGNRQTASGTYAQEGRTIAMPSNIPFGTKVIIDGLGEFTNEDRGGYIKNTYDENGNLIMRVDVFLESHNECYAKGRYLADGYIILE